MADPVVISSRIGIANYALQMCGHRAIADFDDDTAIKAAEIARTTFDNILKTVMSAMAWDFATQHHTLNSVTLPEEVYQYQAAFELPGGVLKVHAVQGQASEPGREWEVRGQNILTNLSEEDGTLKTQLIMYIENVGLYPPAFIKAAASAMAAEWAGPLIRVTSEADRLDRRATEMFRTAASSDSQVGSVKRAQVFASSVTTRGRGNRRFPIVDDDR